MKTSCWRLYTTVLVSLCLCTMVFTKTHIDDQGIDPAVEKVQVLQNQIEAQKAAEKLAAEKLILRKMTQYKISNTLRLTIGNKEVNEHFIKSAGSILK